MGEAVAARGEPRPPIHGYSESMAGRYRGRGRWPETSELIAIILLGVIALWGVWFAVQSLLTLWWPINVGYLLAGLVVALVAVGIARALIIR